MKHRLISKATQRVGMDFVVGRRQTVLHPWAEDSITERFSDVTMFVFVPGL
jgi:hypothetical protein